MIKIQIGTPEHAVSVSSDGLEGEWSTVEIRNLQSTLYTRSLQELLRLRDALDFAIVLVERGMEEGKRG